MANSIVRSKHTCASNDQRGVDGDDNNGGYTRSNQIHATHTGDIDIPLLPATAWYCHIIPGLAKYLLISVVQLCEAWCDVRFTTFGIGIEVWYR